MLLLFSNWIINYLDRSSCFVGKFNDVKNWGVDEVKPPNRRLLRVFHRYDENMVKFCGPLLDDRIRQILQYDVGTENDDVLLVNVLEKAMSGMAVAYFTQRVDELGRYGKRIGEASMK